MPGRRIRLLFAWMIAFSLHVESSYDAWPRYEGLPARVAEANVQALGDSVTLLGSSEALLGARATNSRETSGECSAEFPGTIPPRRQPEVS
jgi:hypothetical protein